MAIKVPVPEKVMLKIKKSLLLLLLFRIASTGFAQHSNQTALILSRLDTLRNSASVARHFAAVYFEITFNSASFFVAADTEIQCLTERMKVRFADYFFRSVYAYEHHQPLPEEWSVYFNTTGATDIQYLLLGINAHLNGDIWRGLITEFTPAELEKVKPHYFSYYAQLVKEYRLIYERALACSPRIRLLHQISFGANRCYGKLMLKRWLKRQMRMAELYFCDEPLFQKKRARLKRKMRNLDKLVKNNT